jgi:predicted kinase
MELVLFIGLQASGKTSFYRARFADTHAHISRDNFRNNRNPTERQRVLIEEVLRSGRSAVVDNTSLTIDVRAPLIALGRELGAEVVGYYFASSLADCLKRNAAREGKARVPDVALYTTVKKLERPSRAEGFDRLFYVRAEDDNWIVEEWKEDSDEAERV